MCAKKGVLAEQMVMNVIIHVIIPRSDASKLVCPQ